MWLGGGVPGLFDRAAIAHHDQASGIREVGLHRFEGRESTALLLLIPDVPNNEGILTGKLFEYLASRRPVIAIGPVNGKASDILKECRAGKMFDRNEPNELYSYLKSLILQWREKVDMSNNDKNYLRYSRKELAGALATLILKKAE